MRFISTRRTQRIFRLQSTEAYQLLMYPEAVQRRIVAHFADAKDRLDKMNNRLSQGQAQRVREPVTGKGRNCMRYTWIDAYLLAKTGVTKDLKKEWNWIRYQIGGKMFAAVCLDQHDVPYYINLKLDPEEGAFLRTQYEDIVPGYYSNKVHWNSVKPDGAVPDDLLKDLLDKSYQLVLGGMSKKKQREILEGTE